MVKVIENMDSGTRKTTLYKAQQRAISSAMRKIPHDEIKLSHGHFFTSGLIRKGETVIYFSTGDFRYFPNTAYARFTEKSNTGMGNNHETNIEHLDHVVKDMFHYSQFISH